MSNCIKSTSGLPEIKVRLVDKQSSYTKSNQKLVKINIIKKAMRQPIRDGVKRSTLSRFKEWASGTI